MCKIEIQALLTSYQASQKRCDGTHLYQHRLNHYAYHQHVYTFASSQPSSIWTSQGLDHRYLLQLHKKMLRVSETFLKIMK